MSAAIKAAIAPWHRIEARRTRLACIQQGVLSACDVVLAALIALMVVAGVEEHGHHITRALGDLVGAQRGEADRGWKGDDIGHATHVAVAPMAHGTMKCAAFQGGVA